MNGDALPNAALRQVFRQGSPAVNYPIDHDRPLVLGRDPEVCQIVLEVMYGMVSRRHAEVRAVMATQESLGRGWWLCDLGSSNGTFLNGLRLRGCHLLQEGDRITLGPEGPEFLFELEPVTLPPEVSRARYRAESQVLAVANSSKVRSAVGDRELTLTQLFPIFSGSVNLGQKAYLVPAIITVSCVVSLFLAEGNPVWFNSLLSGYLALVAYYIVYLLCGKAKPWWIPLCAMTMTVLLLRSPMLPLFVQVFREVLPGAVPTVQESQNFRGGADGGIAEGAAVAGVLGPWVWVAIALARTVGDSGTSGWDSAGGGFCSGFYDDRDAELLRAGDYSEYSDAVGGGFGPVGGVAAFDS
jgi:FHA domain